MASWPLSKNLLWGLSWDPGEGSLRTGVDNGTAKLRRRATAPPEPITGNLILNGAELATLISWWKTTLARGTLPFTWEHPLDDTTVNLRWVSRPVASLALGGGVYDRKWRVPVILEVVA